MEKKRCFKKRPINKHHGISKKELYFFTKKLYSSLKDEIFKINLKKLRLCEGKYYPDSVEIDLDYRRSLLPALLHEVIHHIYPKWSETKVLSYESRIINSLTIRQIKNIIVSLGNSL